MIQTMKKIHNAELANVCNGYVLKILCILVPFFKAVLGPGAFYTCL